jgi:streptomycin 6-kinase
MERRGQNGPSAWEEPSVPADFACYDPVAMELPREFRQRIGEVHGDAGVAWLEELPALLREFESAWGVSLQEPFPLCYNYVAAGMLADGTEVVLKAGPPQRELRTETAALRLYDGRACVRLLEADPDRGLLLLERIRPGTPLFALEEGDAASGIAADLMRELWRPLPPDHDFPTVADWARGMERLRAHFDSGTGPLPRVLVEAAESLFADLLRSQDAPVLLHGDLHHWNILRSASGRPWLALDPKGVAGEAAYEVGAFLRNPLPRLLDEGDAKRTLERRVDLLAERLGFDRERLLAWGLAQAVLSAWWSIEDHGSGWEPAIAVAQVLLEIDGGG